MFGVVAATAADSLAPNYGRLTRTVQVEAIEMAAERAGRPGLNDPSGRSPGPGSPAPGNEPRQRTGNTA